MTKWVAAASATVLAMLVTAPLASAGTQDQSQTRAEQRRPFGGPHAAQTFTEGRTGSLDLVEVVIDRDCERTFDVRVEIRTVSADGQPTSDVIAGETVPAEQVPFPSQRVSVVLDPSAEVTAGTKYAIVLSAQESYCEDPPAVPGGLPTQRPAYWWSGATGDGLGRPRFPGSPYAGGQGWTRYGGAAWQAVENFDFAFTTYVVDAPTPPGSPSEVPFPGDPTPGAAADTAAPETEIRKSPKRTTERRAATVAFRSSEAGSSFECKLDKGPYRACGSPTKLKRLGPGRHRFSVRAIDAAGNVDPTPARVRWRVLG